MNNNLITTSDFDYAQIIFKYLTYFSYTLPKQDYYNKMIISVCTVLKTTPYRTRNSCACVLYKLIIYIIYSTLRRRTMW